MGALSFPARRGIQGFFLFILLFGEKNEPRRTAARYRAFSLARRRLTRGLRNSLRSHSPRPLSALGCRPPGPIRAVSPFPYLHVFAFSPFVPFTFLFEWGHCHSPLDGESLRWWHVLTGNPCGARPDGKSVPCLPCKKVARQRGILVMLILRTHGSLYAAPNSSKPTK